MGIQGEWDKGVRKEEEEILVAVSKSGGDMRDTQRVRTFNNIGRRWGAVRNCR